MEKVCAKMKLAGAQIEREKRPALKEYLKLIRVKHWIKNVFVLASLVFSLNFCKSEYLLRILQMCLSFCLALTKVEKGF